MHTVSVVIPAYNSERFLGEAVLSALSQDCPTEVIVVDDGSTDATAEIAQALPVRYLHQEHSGQGQARNLGAKAAQGEFLAFLDSDDLWPQGKLRKQTEALIEAPTVDMAFGHAQQFTQQGPVGDPLPAQLPGTMLIRRLCWAATPGFDPQWRVGEFIDWYIRAKERGFIDLMLPEVVLHRRLHGNNLGSSKQGREDYIRILKQALDRRRASGE